MNKNVNFYNEVTWIGCIVTVHPLKYSIRFWEKFMYKLKIMQDKTIESYSHTEILEFEVSVHEN